MTTISLLCHVERRRPNDGAGRCFSLNVSVGLADPQGLTQEQLAAVIDAYLRPWEWKLSNIVVAEVREATPPRVLPDVEVKKPVTTDVPDAWRGVLQQRLNGLKGAGAIDGRVFLWPERAGSMEEHTYDEAAAGLGPAGATADSKRRWALELLDLSREVAPLPHAANLACWFVVKDASLAEDAVLVAAPRLSFGDGSTWEPNPAGPTPAASSVGSGRFEWKYQRTTGSGAATAVSAHMNGARVASTADGWIDVQHGLFGEDWLAELEWRLADLFDLPTLVLRFLGTLPAKEEVEKQRLAAAVSAFREPLWACLRDLVQTGATCGARVMPGAPQRPATTQPSLSTEIGLAGDMLRELVRNVGGGSSPDDFDRILARVEAWETNEAGVEVWWLRVLQEAWKEPDPGPSPEDAVRGLSQLRAWCAHCADDERARTFVLEQWDEALQGVPSWWARHREAMRTLVLPGIGVRKRLAMMHLGVRWDEITKALPRAANGAMPGPSDIANALETSLVEQILDYLDDRAWPNEVPTNGSTRPKRHTDLPRARTAPADWPVWRQEFREWLATSTGSGAQPERGYVHRVLKQSVLAGAGAVEELEPGVQADGIVIRVAPAAGDDDVGSAADEEERGLAGYGVLLCEWDRRERAYCLNLADVQLLSPHDSVAAKSAVAPIRIALRNGIRRSLVTYHNEPICAFSPAADLAQNHNLVDRASLHTESWKMLRNPYRGETRLPSLRFGRDYGAAVFGIGVGGLLPRAIADGVDPTRYVPPTGAADIPWVQHCYRRRVAIGPLRLGKGGPGDPVAGRLGLPPIPPTVQSLAASLGALSGNGQATEPERTLILLAPPPGDGFAWNESVVERHAKFTVAPPTVDIQVWDRSFDFVETPAGARQRTRRQRIAVWKETFVKRDRARAVSGEDASVDDPAVEAVVFRLSRIFPDGSAEPKEGAIAWTRPAKDGLDGETATVLHCRIDSVTAESGDLDVVSNPVRVSVPKGEIWRLEIFPAVPMGLRGDFQRRLWNEMERRKWTDPTSQRDYVLGLPRTMLVEVAKGDMPTAAQLHESLRARAVIGGAEGPARAPWTEPLVFGLREGAEALRAGCRIEVAVDPTRAASNRQAFAYVHGVTVLVQRWRWNGRPLRDAAFSASDAEDQVDQGDPGELTPAAFFAQWQGGGETQQALTAWDGRLFGDRAATDYRRHDAVVDLVSDGLEAGACRIFSEDVSNEPGALYVRVAVQARSRYAGMLANRVEDSRLGLMRADGSGVPEAWRRLVVPCRYDKEVPPPRVKLVLPLTDLRSAVDPASPDATTPDSTPGLLVVLAEPWFRYGGLAEELVAEIAVADEPERDESLDLPPRRAEIGPDPIVDGDGRLVVPPGDQAAGAFGFEPLPAYGPIGHTFDTDTLSPEFVHTSFIVPAPELTRTGADGDLEVIGDLSWYFLKLRFRRRLEPAACAVPLANHESEPTGTVWAQLLPPSSRFYEERGDGSVVDVATRDLVLVRNDEKWFIARGDTSPRRAARLRPTLVAERTVAPGAAEPAPKRFELWALVTEPLFDAYGRGSQERFLDFCQVRDGVLEPSVPVWTAKVGQPRRARLVEVQRLPLADATGTSGAGPSLAGVKTLFFPEHPRNLAECQARILRVSAPIDQ